MCHLDYSFRFTFCLVYGTTLCWLWLLIMAGHLMMVVTTGLFVVKKEASEREGSEEWLLFMEQCCRGLESRARSFFTWLTGTQPSSILQVCPHWLLRILRSRHSFRSLKCSVRVVNCPFLITVSPLLSPPPGDLFFPSTFEGGLKRERGAYLI